MQTPVITDQWRLVIKTIWGGGGKLNNKYSLNINFALLSVWAANFSMTLWLKSVISGTSLFSMDSIANAFSLSWVLVFLRKVFILLKVEKHLSASTVVRGVVMMIFRRVKRPLLDYSP